MEKIISAALLAFGMVVLGMAWAPNRYDVVPTPRGTIVIDKVRGEAYQLPALPMFQTRE